jgi:hypothetical protein
MNEENSQAKDGLPKPMKGNPVFKYARKFNKAKKFVDQKKRMKAGYSKHKGGMGEALDPSMGAGEYVKDFYKSDAPQFKGKSKSKRRQMAIAAYLKDKGQNEGKNHSWKTTGHYKKDGTEFTGSQHAHDGQVMTGKTHTDDSENLYHYKDLSPKAKKKAEKTMREASAQDRFLNRLKKKHGYDPDEREKFYADMKKKFQQTSAKAVDSSKIQKEETKSGDKGLRDWFGKSKSSDGKKGWVQLGGKFAGKPCARQPGQTSTPKCGSSKMKRNLDKDEEERAFRRKNRQDPNQPDKRGGAKPTNVRTEAADKPGKGSGTKDACYHKVKSRYSVWPSAYASGALVKCRKVGAKNWGNKSEEKEIAEKCWPGYKKKGMKTMFGKRYPNCVKEEDVEIIFKNMLHDAFLGEEILDYDPTPGHMEWGTPQGTKYMKQMTPGETEAGETKKKYREDNEEDAEALELSSDDIRALEHEADHLSFKQMIELGMYDEEDFELDDDDVHADVHVTEVLSVQGRLKRKFAARKNKQKLRVARKIALRRASSPDRMRKRARRGARAMVYKRVLRGRTKANMPPAERQRFEKMLDTRFANIISRLQVRMLPQMRRKEIARLKSRSGKKASVSKKYKAAKPMKKVSQKAKKFRVKK